MGNGKKQKTRYAPGTFGYWWTEVERQPDIGGKHYNGDIDAVEADIQFPDGMPRSVSDGSIDLSGTGIVALPENLLVAGNLLIHNCKQLERMPVNLEVGRNLYLWDCLQLISLSNARWKIGGSVYAYGCTNLASLPTRLEIGNCMDLCDCKGLKALPDGTKVAKNIILENCSSLVYLPSGMNIKGYIRLDNCTGLTTFPDELTAGAGISLTNCTGLTSLTGKLNPGVYLDVAHCTNLISLPSKLQVLWLSVEGCVNLKFLPDDLEAVTIYGAVHHWRGKRWSFFDGIAREVRSVQQVGDLMICKMVDGTYAVYDGKYSSHGATLTKAKSDLRYKRSLCDLSRFQELTLDSELTLEQCIDLYRSVTRACAVGIENFIKSQPEIRAAYTVREVIELTAGQYGHDLLVNFFKLPTNGPENVV